MNLQEALAEELKGFIDNDEDEENKTEEAESEQELSKEDEPTEEAAEGVVKPDTAEIYDDEEEDESGVFSPMASVAAEDAGGAMQEVFFDSESAQEEPSADEDFKPYSEEEEASEEPSMGIEIKYGGNGPILGEEKKLDYAIPVFEDKPLEDEVPGAVIHPNSNFQMHSHFDNILAQEYDGQISMAVEPEPQVEKQITGQISIAEYMENWEQFKRQQQEKQFQKVKQLVADETGDMFADYDEKTKEGLQEKIEQAISDALKKERHDKASGRGDWSRNNSDVIDDAVAEVINNEGVAEQELPETEEEAEDAATETAAEVDTEESAVSGTEEAATNDTEVAADTEEAAETEENAEGETSEEAEASDEKTDSDSAEGDSAESEEAKGEESSDAEGEKADGDKADSEGDKAENKPSNKKAPNGGKGKNGRKPEPGQKKRHHIGNRELEERVRPMTPEEKELFGPYIHHKKSRRQIINAIDNLSMDAYSGNAIVTGEEGAGTVNLAKGLIRAVQASDSNFSGKVAKITANTLNKKSVKAIFEKLANGALIVQRAADLTQETVGELIKVLQQENKGIIVVMEDTKEDINRFLDKNPSLKQSFNVRVDIEALDDDSLVAYAKQYALEREFAIDNLGILALHTRISERQTLDHEVTVSEVKDIIDDAIYYAEKHSVAHLMDVIVNKRYDENDMIILREKDFMH